MPDPPDSLIPAVRARHESQERKRRKETEAKILALKDAAKATPTDLDQQISDIQAAADAHERMMEVHNKAEIISLQDASKAFAEAQNARKLASNNKSANNQDTSEDTGHANTEDHAGTISTRTPATRWVIMPVLLLALLLVAAVRLHVEHLPDHRLEATFQVYNRVATMFNYNGMGLDSQRRTVQEAALDISSIGFRMQATQLPDKDKIARVIDVISETMHTIADRVNNLQIDTEDTFAEIWYYFHSTVAGLEDRSRSPWYAMRNLLIPVNAILRREWMRTAVRSRSQLERLSARANGLRIELSNVAKAIDGIEQEMVASQRTHEEEVKRLKSRWFYRFNIFAGPILEYDCGLDAERMANYLPRVGEVGGRLIARRDVLAAASHSLLRLESMTRRERVLELFRRFGHDYQVKARSMLRSLNRVVYVRSETAPG